MPLTIPAGLLTRANFLVAVLKPFVDGVESNASSALSNATAASSTASDAQTTANQKYTKPAGGIPVTDLAPGAVNTVWLTPTNGVWAARPTTSTNVTYVWVRRTLTDPVVPLGGTGAIVGVDFVLQPDA